MYSTLVSVALFSALAIQGALAEFTVNTPEVTQCEPVKLTWDNVNAKTYNVAVVSSTDPCNDVLIDLGDHDQNHMTWTPKLEAGQTVMISVLADDDAEGWSGSIKIKAGDASCLGKTSSAASTTASTSGSAKATGTGTTLVVNPAAAPTNSAAAPAAPSSSSGAQAVGAANSGILGGSDNGAFASVRFSASSLALSAVVAVAALAF